VEAVPRLSWPPCAIGLSPRPPASFCGSGPPGGGAAGALHGKPSGPAESGCASAAEPSWARYLPLAGGGALEVLSLHRGPRPVELAEALGLKEEDRGWLAFQGGGYCLTEPQFRPYLAAGPTAGPPQAEAGPGFRRARGREWPRPTTGTKGGRPWTWGFWVGAGLWPAPRAAPPPCPGCGSGLRLCRILEGLEEVHLVSLGGEEVGVDWPPSSLGPLPQMNRPPPGGLRSAGGLGRGPGPPRRPRALLGPRPGLGPIGGEGRRRRRQEEEP